MIAVVIGVALLTTISQADEKCKGGNINQHLCQKTCNLSSCSCDMTETSPFTSCAQKCHFFSSCPVMVCSGKPNFFLCRKGDAMNIILVIRAQDLVAASRLPPRCYLIGIQIGESPHPPPPFSLSVPVRSLWARIQRCKVNQCLQWRILITTRRGDWSGFRSEEGPVDP